MAQREITEPLSVLDESGRPGNFGWARIPLFFYNPALIRAPHRRITESDRYLVFSHTHLMSFEISDSGYLGYVGISIFSLKDKKRSTQIFTVPFPLGSFKLSGGSETGSVRVQPKDALVDFIVMESGARIIKVDVPKFGHHRNLRGALVLSPLPEAESMVTNMPWRREKSAFRYSRSSPWYITEGVMQFGGSELVFTKDNAWGIFDWNRGVRPRGDTHYWAAACGLSGGLRIGFTVGYGSADSGLGTENAFFLEGKLHKLDQVTFHIPSANWLEPWRFTSSDKRLEMTFTPNQERFEGNRIFFYSLKRRQVCGFFSGTVVLDDGSELEFHNITGFAERKKTRY
ncbi:MAG: DUF2804 domain-containing protein [Spirochaetaceae bacterium]|jgi:hypothetical protein|nr:DUF2804 domain-containing protein [Spirochaetaceae bacterium]